MGRRAREGFGRRWRNGQARVRHSNLASLRLLKKDKAPSPLELLGLGAFVFICVLAGGLSVEPAIDVLKSLPWTFDARPLHLAQDPTPSHRYFANCRAAHAAGAYSIRRDEPGYREPLDADGDGLACEPYVGN